MNTKDKITVAEARREARKKYYNLQPEGYTLKEWISEYVQALKEDGYVK